MSTAHRPNASDVDDLLLNARLRDELEPFVDESLELLNRRCLPTGEENEFLASMLAWERAPVIPIGQWFDPELDLLRPELLDDTQIHRALWDVIQRLAEKKIVLDFTDHLSDRELYCLIYRDILPSPEKKIDGARHFLHWACVDVSRDEESWLRYYANEEERAAWEEENGESAPPMEEPPFPRRMPRRGL